LCPDGGGAGTNEHAEAAVGRLVACAKVRESKCDIDGLGSGFDDAVPGSAGLVPDGVRAGGVVEMLYGAEEEGGAC
jgi:hypothetical protein